MPKLVTNSRYSPGIIDDISIYKLSESPNPLRPSPKEIAELALSIRQKGLLQPIIVRPHDHYFEIVAGNRRYHACKSLGWKNITCHIVNLDDKEAFEVSLIENVQRKTLSPIEEAQAFKTYVSDFGWGGVSELALRLGKSPSYITKRIKLLELPLDVIDSINLSTISPSIAEELYPIKDKAKQSELADLVSKRHLSLRATRELIKDVDGDGDKELDPGEKDFIEDCPLYQKQECDPTEKVQRALDKSIVSIRIALNRLGSIIEGIEDCWIIEEMLMQHRNVLHTQIDLLIKQKRKYDQDIPVLTH